MSYEIYEHRHRFSVWAAARATQRGLKGGKTPVLREALETCGVVAFLANDPNDIDGPRIDVLHREWCFEIVKRLKSKGVATASYGHAAKLVNVYLKSVVVLGPMSDTKLAHVAHPPIDEILLSNMSTCPKINSAHKQEWAKIKWTTLDDGGYFKLVGQLRKCLNNGEPFWMLEQFWTVSK